jgi:hypothetical protein
MLLLVAVGFLGSVTGCHRSHSHGICDCEFDDHCRERAPWLRLSAPSAAETVAPPTKLPDGKKRDLE